MARHLPPPVNAPPAPLQRQPGLTDQGNTKTGIIGAKRTHAGAQHQPWQEERDFQQAQATTVGRLGVVWPQGDS
jgi:hypothetical protein